MAVRPDFALTRDERAGGGRDRAPPRRAAARDRARRGADPAALAGARSLQRLERRLELLSAARATCPARQRTLRGAIAWSHDLLDAGRAAAVRAPRRLRRRLAARRRRRPCAGTAGDGALGRARRPRAPRRPEPAPVGDEPHGDARFAMLETIREYALEKLEERGETERAAGPPRSGLPRVRRGRRSAAPDTTAAAAAHAASSTASRTSTTTSGPPSSTSRGPATPRAPPRSRSPCGGSGSNAATSSRAGTGSTTCWRWRAGRTCRRGAAAGPRGSRRTRLLGG